MQVERNIFEVYAKVCDANGAWNTLSGYPKFYDSKLYDNDIEKARRRAYGEYHACLGTMYPRDDRQLQLAMIIDGSTGVQIEVERIGAFASVDVPDPEPEPEPDPEPEPEGE